MPYRILADLVVVLHFAWILFMLAGFIGTVAASIAVLCSKRSSAKVNFFDWAMFRCLHLLGIIIVAVLALSSRYCPVTILENLMRRNYDHQTTYPDAFIVHYIEKFVYPNVNPLAIIIPTAAVAAFTLAAFIIRPPTKIKNLFKKRA